MLKMQTRIQFRLLTSFLKLNAYKCRCRVLYFPLNKIPEHGRMLECPLVHFSPKTELSGRFPPYLTVELIVKNDMHEKIIFQVLPSYVTEVKKSSAYVIS